MDSDSQPRKFFAGEFRHSIDEKNRITIPSCWRRNEGEDFIILPEPHDQFLLVMSAAKFILVVLFFMHLRYDSRVLATVFFGPLVIAIAFVVALTTLTGAFLVYGR